MTLNPSRDAPDLLTTVDLRPNRRADRAISRQAPSPARHGRSGPAPRRRTLLRCTAALVTTIFAAVPTTSVVFAQSQPSPSRTEPASPTPTTSDTPTSTTIVEEDLSPIQLPAAEVIIDDDPRVDPSLAAVALDSGDYAASVGQYLRTFDRLKQTVERRDEASGRFNRATAELGELLTARNRLQGVYNSAVRRRDKAQTRQDEIRQKLRGLAVDQYIRGGLGGAAEATFDLSRADDVGRQRVLIQSVHNDQLIEARLAARVHDEQATLGDTTEAELVGVSERVRTEEANRDRAGSDRDRAERERTTLLQELAAAKRGVADARMTADVQGMDFTLVVFNAYVRAAATMAIEQPSCGIRWSALAGIGRTESRHGTFDDATVDAEGNETKPIYGIALDGTNGTAVIGDTDDGELDDFPEGDRATGPMQFIPGTWRTVQRDGNGDGRADPQNYYDASLTAAVYLCRKGPGLDTDEGLRRAFRSYNNSGEYVETVLDRTHQYQRHVPPPVPEAKIGDPYRVPLPTTTSTSTTSTTRAPRAPTTTTGR